MKTIITKREEEINNTAALNMNLKIFADALAAGNITKEKYEMLCKMVMEQR